VHVSDLKHQEHAEDASDNHEVNGLPSELSVV